MSTQLSLPLNRPCRSQTRTLVVEAAAEALPDSRSKAQSLATALEAKMPQLAGPFGANQAPPNMQSDRGQSARIESADPVVGSSQNESASDSAAVSITHIATEPLTQAATEAPTADLEPSSKRRRLEQALSGFSSEPTNIVVHDNRSIMVSGFRRAGVLTIRVHHMFLGADSTVLKAVARFAATSNKRAKAVVDAYIHEHEHLITRASRNRIERNASGKHFDLKEVFAQLNAHYFDNKVKADIGFGRAGSFRRRRRSSIRLGSYDSSERSITIHPSLDQAFVPRVFVAYIVYHEMLHQVFPSQQIGATLSHHGRDFRTAEKLFEGRREAVSWYRDNQDRILRYRG